jgi:hypothetical protein
MKTKIKITINTQSECDYDVDITNKTFLQTESTLIYLNVNSRYSLMKKLKILNRRFNNRGKSSNYNNNMSFFRRLCSLNNWKYSRYIGSLFDRDENVKKILFFQVIENEEYILVCRYYHMKNYNNAIALSSSFLDGFYEHIQENKEKSVFCDYVWY